MPVCRTLPDQAAARFWERQGAVFCGAPPPLFWVAGMTATQTGWPAASRTLATGHVVVPIGGKGVGGGEEAHGITGRG